MEVRRLAQSVIKQILARRALAADVIPRAVGLGDACLDFRFVRLADELHELLAALVHRVALRLRMLQLLAQRLRSAKQARDVTCDVIQYVV